MSEPTVFIVDDDKAVRDSLALLVTSVGLEAKVYGTAQEFLDVYDTTQPGCLVSDMRMPGISGLELQDRLLEKGVRLPLIMITAYGDVSAAVRALKGGAIDFIEKPYDPQKLLDLIQQAIARDAEIRDAAAREAAVAARVETLTPREREVMELIVQGRANKVVAIDLDISERTVELHRAKIMKKMEARSLAELVRLAQALGVED